MDSEAQELELYIKYDKGEPVAYAYGEPWVAMALYMGGMGYPTAEEAIAAFKEKRQWLKNTLQGGKGMKSNEERTYEIYPLTIVLDRYTGAYSGGYFTAWNCDFMDVPEEIDLDDVTCYEIWNEIREGRFSRKNDFGEPIKVGVGDTPQEAIENLRSQIQAAKREGDGE